MKTTANENNEIESKASTRRFTSVNVQVAGSSIEVAEISPEKQTNLELSTSKKTKKSLQNTPSVRRSTRKAMKINSEFADIATPSSAVPKIQSNEVMENFDVQKNDLTRPRSARKTISKILDYNDITSSKGLGQKLNFDKSEDVNITNNKDDAVQKIDPTVNKIKPHIVDEVKIENTPRSSTSAVCVPKLSDVANKKSTLLNEITDVKENQSYSTDEEMKGSLRDSSIVTKNSKSNKKINKKAKKRSKKNSELNVKMANLSMDADTGSENHSSDKSTNSVNNDEVAVINKTKNTDKIKDVKSKTTDNKEKIYKHISADDEYENLDSLPIVINGNSSSNDVENKIINIEIVNIDNVNNTIGRTLSTATTIDLTDDEDDNFIPLLVISDDEDEFLHTPVKNTSVSLVDKKIATTPFPREKEILTVPLSASTDITPIILVDTPIAKIRKDYNPHPTPHTKTDFNAKQEEVKYESNELESFTIKEVECTPISRKTSKSAKKDKILKTKAVTFNSADNRITKIADIDEIINKSIKKQNVEQLGKSEMNVNVKRRKRSFDELADENEELKHKIAKPDANTAASSRSSQKVEKVSQKATKLPNFAAIHQKQFNKMENLSEYVTRKTERAKNLINSGVKLVPSASKVITLKSNTNAQTGVLSKALKSINFYGKTVTPAKSESIAGVKDKSILLSTDLKKSKSTDRVQSFSVNSSSKKMLPIVRKAEQVDVKPKAAKKIDLNAAVVKTISNNKFEEEQTTLARKIDSNAAVKTVLDNKLDEEQNKLARLPNPRLGVIKQQMTSNKSETELKLGESNKPMAHITPLKQVNNNKMLRPQEGPQLRAIEKAAQRRERHMNMYKGRTGATHTSTQARDAEIIRGVRSNRRFELQMKYRNQLKD